LQVEPRLNSRTLNFWNRALTRSLATRVDAR
jgi:hypothetical protein